MMLWYSSNQISRQQAPLVIIRQQVPKISKKKWGKTSHDEIKELCITFTFQVFPVAARNQTCSGLHGLSSCPFSSEPRTDPPGRTGHESVCQLQTSQVNAIISWEEGTVQGVGWWSGEMESWRKTGDWWERPRSEAQTNPGTKFRPQPKCHRHLVAWTVGLWGRTRNHKGEEKLNHEDMG
jgi:hypothetical protein